MAVVHQRISQLNSSGLMNIESSHKFTRSGDTASGCIEAVNMDDYQVGVLGERQVQPVMTGMKGTITIILVSLNFCFEITMLFISVLIITDSLLCIGCIAGSGTNYVSSQDTIIIINMLTVYFQFTSKPEINRIICFCSNLFTVLGAVVIIIFVTMTISVVLYIAKRGNIIPCYVNGQVHMTVVSPLVPLLAKQTRSSSEVTVHVEMKRCAAYEITTLVRKKIVMETNPAYEQVTMSTLRLQ